MKANEFVKEFGWDGAKRVFELTIGNSWADHYNIKEDSIGTAGTIYSKKLCEHNDNFVCLRNLKRLVDSHELVERLGGLESCNRLISQYGCCESSSHLQYHVANVESCQ